MRDLKAEFLWLCSLKVDIKDKRAFRGVDVRQIHHWLWKRGFRPDPWMLRIWRNPRYKDDDDGKPIGFNIIDGNGYADRIERFFDVLKLFSELYDKSMFLILMEIRATKPKAILKPYFGVGEAVRLRHEWRSKWDDATPPTQTTIGKGTVGVIKRVVDSPKRWIVYHVLFEEFAKTFPIQQLEIERASMLDVIANTVHQAERRDARA